MHKGLWGKVSVSQLVHVPGQGLQAFMNFCALLNPRLDGCISMMLELHHQVWTHASVPRMSLSATSGHMTSSMLANQVTIMILLINDVGARADVGQKKTEAGW